MTADGLTTPVSKGKLWTGRILSGVLALFLLADGVAKVMRAGPVLKSFDQLGYSQSVSIPIGIVLLACTVLYLIPQTSVLGAILLTGYLGGATATHVRAGQPFYFPIVFGILIWLGLYLRETRLHALVPMRN